ncbi:MAG: hypothetical protein CFE45_37805, partial [Burkholderiales bacterium PBB5]
MKTTGRPLIITARDAGLTLLLWLGCGWMWFQLFPEFERWLKAHRTEGLEFELPSIVVLLRDGALLTVGLLTVYLIWAVRNWRKVDADLARPVPAHLQPDEEARAYGVAPADLPALRAAPSLT